LADTARTNSSAPAPTVSIRIPQICCATWMKSVFVRRHEAAAIPSCYTNFFKLENSDCPGFEIPLGIAAMASVSHPAVLRRRLFLRGIVQGVGFRPFVYNLAQRHGIRGFVLN